jgi:type I restriction enzyme S subunit
MRSDYRKFPVPPGWSDTTIGEVAEVVGGGTPSTGNPEYWNGGILWATPTDVTALESRYISQTKTTISGAGLRNSGASLLPARSVLVTSRATIGACAINTVPMATNQGFASLIPKDNLSTEFLYYVLTARADELNRTTRHSYTPMATSEITG